MNYATTFLNGVCFGSGLIVAALIMEKLFHIGFCGG